MVTAVKSPCTQGSQLRQTSVGGVLLTEAVYQPGSWLAPHTHDHMSMVFLRVGAYRERLGRFEESMRPGMLYVREAGLVHSNMFGAAGARCIFIDHADALLDGTDGGQARGYRAHADALVRLAGERLANEPWRDDPASRMILHGLVLELVGLASRRGNATPTAAPTWLTTARDRLIDEAAHPPAIGDLAREAGVHPCHFIRTFRRHVGVRPGQFLHQVRIARACGLLMNDSLTLADIAASTGFADQSHFGRIFRRVMGTTPARWRRDRR